MAKLGCASRFGAMLVGLLWLLGPSGIGQGQQSLAGEGGIPAASPHKRLLLLSSAPDGHAAKSHEYRACLDELQSLLVARGNLEVVHHQVTQAWDSALAELERADGVVLYLSEGARWITSDPRRKEAFLNAEQQGKGFFVIHWSLGTREADAIPTMLQLIGACHGGPDRKYRVMTGALSVADEKHPVTQGIESFTIHDEFYYDLKKVTPAGEGALKVQPISPLLTVSIDGAVHPVAWAWERSQADKSRAGRSVGFVGGHFQSAWRHAAYERFLVQAAYWIVDQPVPPRAAVTVNVVEKSSQKLSGARVYLQGADGAWHFPLSTAIEGSALRYEKSRPDGAVEMHTTVSPHPFRFHLAPGKYRLLVERGTEYLPVEKSIEVSADANDQQLTVEVSRWIHMAEQGWYSGDTHIHRPLVDMPNLMMAEDVNMTFPLSHWVTTADSDAVAGNRIKDSAPPPKAIAVGPNQWIYPLNTEYEIFTVNGKSHTLGAFVGIGHKQPLTMAAPPLSKIAAAIHEQGGLIDLEKHSWPWSISMVPLMKADLFELSNNHCWRTKFALRDWTIAAADDYMQLEKEPGGHTEWGWIDFGFQTYYALLNCGFHLSPTAGTGQGVHPVPMGFSRVYVHPEGEFTYETWLKALKEGRSFVTTGPMLQVKLGGKLPGASWKLPAGNEGADFILEGTAAARHPIDRIEVVDQTGVIKVLRPESIASGNGGWQASIQEKIEVRQSGWVAVRCFEKHPEGRVRFAHSAPFYLQKEGSQLLPTRPQIAYLVRRCREEVERNRGVVSAEAMEEYQAALQFYEAIAKQVEAGQ